MAEAAEPIDIDSFWEYSDPEASEKRFRQALVSAQGDERLELQTQIARTYGLRQQFDEAQELLDEIEEQLDGAGPRPRVRYLVERGRTFNSSGQKEKARPLFIEAWETARAERFEGLAVDAAHMVAITSAGEPEAIEWNQRGLEIARESQDAKARALIPAMLNNNAWDLFDMGRYGEALPLFEEALVEWNFREKVQQIQIAKWSVARCLRALNRYEDALALQRELDAEHTAAGTVDGYVFEEIAENLAALGDMEAATPYYGQAYEELQKDDWFAENEAERLARLRELSGN